MKLLTTRRCNLKLGEIPNKHCKSTMTMTGKTRYMPLPLDLVFDKRLQKIGICLMINLLALYGKK